MNITAKQIQRSNVVFVFDRNSVSLPEAAQVFALYPGPGSKGALFSDNTSMATRVFDFPEIGYQIVCEPDKIRLEDKKSRTPDVSKLGVEMVRIITALYPNATPIAYGFNYDMIYRTSVVIPMLDIMSHFLKHQTVEQVKDFGWQYTVSAPKSKNSETYFFKAVSPIELSVHANFHFGEYVPHKSTMIQSAFERGYKDADDGLAHTSF
jgi:hypothetical protein